MVGEEGFQYHTGNIIITNVSSFSGYSGVKWKVETLQLFGFSFALNFLCSKVFWGSMFKMEKKNKTEEKSS